MSHASSPYSTYEVTSIETASQSRLIVMLYDGAIRFMNKGAECIDNEDIENAHRHLTRSTDIVSELLSGLRLEQGGDLGRNLQRLYVFVFEQIVEANLRKDAAQARRMVGIMGTLREGWVEVMNQTTAGKRPYAKRTAQQRMVV